MHWTALSVRKTLRYMWTATCAQLSLVAKTGENLPTGDRLICFRCVQNVTMFREHKISEFYNWYPIRQVVSRVGISCRWSGVQLQGTGHRKPVAREVRVSNGAR